MVPRSSCWLSVRMFRTGMDASTLVMARRAVSTRAAAFPDTFSTIAGALSVPIGCA